MIDFWRSKGCQFVWETSSSHRGITAYAVTLQYYDFLSNFSEFGPFLIIATSFVPLLNICSALHAVLRPKLCHWQQKLASSNHFRHQWFSNVGMCRVGIKASTVDISSTSVGKLKKDAQELCRYFLRLVYSSRLQCQQLSIFDWFRLCHSTAER